jgi:hypothetical protein
VSSLRKACPIFLHLATDSVNLGCHPPEKERPMLNIALLLLLPSYVDSNPRRPENLAMIRAKEVLKKLEKDSIHQGLRKDLIQGGLQRGEINLVPTSEKPDLSATIGKLVVDADRPIRVSDEGVAVHTSAMIRCGANTVGRYVIMSYLEHESSVWTNDGKLLRIQDGDNSGYDIAGRREEMRGTYVSPGRQIRRLTAPGEYIYFRMVVAYPVTGGEPIILDAKIDKFVVEP